jgi:hypothetical protein
MPRSRLPSTPGRSEAAALSGSFTWWASVHVCRTTFPGRRSRALVTVTAGDRAIPSRWAAVISTHFGAPGGLSSGSVLGIGSIGGTFVLPGEVRGVSI